MGFKMETLITLLARTRLFYLNPMVQIMLLLKKLNLFEKNEANKKSAKIKVARCIKLFLEVLVSKLKLGF